ncbi:MAG: hypothetical protein A3H44_01785 [Gammaproteobacteria bacterium RIFCSPLOWO2_02_FULL_57_10]|nr:MAG: hypothetical protein A3H44_01785 [Gammaproteobacteria bacterium RIFCSPLOWO2_02_FULL_57_10]
MVEIKRGILDKPVVEKRNALEGCFTGAVGPQALFAGRILPFDEPAALVLAELMTEGKAVADRATGLIWSILRWHDQMRVLW